MLSLAINQGFIDQEAGTTHFAEDDLIQSAVKGDLTAFNRLVILHQDSLYWWVVSLVKDQTQAQDITQSAFITAYEKLNTFRKGSFKAWLFTIARNRSYDELRRRKRCPSLSLDETVEEDDRDWLELLPDSALPPEETLIASEQSELVEQMIRSLPEVFQQVVQLIDLEGLDYQDAAKILGLPLGTVKSRITRARLKMRSLAERFGLS